jgi:hypothetical protein
MVLLSITKGLAIATSFSVGGAMAVVSLLTVPALLAAPHNIAAKQFKLIYGIGIITQPSAVVVNTLLHAFLAYRLHQLAGGASQSTWGAWATGAVMSASILPLTFALMVPTSRQLLGIAGTGEKREGGTEIAEKTEGLLRRWSALNVVRSVLSIGAGAMGLATLLEEL